jgi:transcriptional regulator with XRE-family HTH domain
MTLDPITTALRARRTDLGLTQTQLGARLGITKGAVSRLERGAGGSPLLATLRPWAQALGFDIYTAPRLDPRGRRGIPAYRPCGTISAAKRHYSRGELLDDACRTAQRTYDRDRKRAARREATK